MPPRVLNVTSAIRATSREPYVCTSCLLKSAIRQISLKPATKPPLTRPRAQFTFSACLPRRSDQARQRRCARSYATNGSLASSTAINAPSSVPPAYRELYQRLLALQETARSYVDLSRLQLATRSLESDTPTIRVALLGLGTNGELAARKLARVLLSDPLSDTEAWEEQILQASQDKGATLLRYGDPEDDTSNSHPTHHVTVFAKEQS